MRKLNEIEKDLYACLQCGYCRDTCPVHGQIGWESGSARGKVDCHKKIREKVVAKRNPYDEPMEKRAAWLPPEIELSPNPEVVFFTGCTEAYRMQPLAVATAKLLDKAGVKFNVLGEDEWCCGSPLPRTGQKQIGTGALA